MQFIKQQHGLGTSLHIIATSAQTEQNEHLILSMPFRHYKSVPCPLIGHDRIHRSDSRSAMRLLAFQGPLSGALFSLRRRQYHGGLLPISTTSSPTSPINDAIRRTTIRRLIDTSFLHLKRRVSPQPILSASLPDDLIVQCALHDSQHHRHRH